MAWAGALAGAALSAYSARQQANAANQSRSGSTNQTTEQDPYLSGYYQTDIQRILDMQRSLVERGPNYIGGPGSGYQPGGGWPTASNDYRTDAQRRAQNFGGAGTSEAADAIREWRNQRNSDMNRTGDSSGGPLQADSAPAAGEGSRSSAPTPARRGGVSGTVVNGHFLPDREPAGGWSRADRAEIARRNSGGVTGGPTPGGGGSANNSPRTAEEIFREVARRGLDAGNSPEMDAARRFSTQVLGGAGTGEQTGFEGYNPINDALARRLQGDPRDTQDLLRRFMDSGSFGGGPDGGGSGGGGGGGNGYVSRAQYNQWTSGGSNPNNGGGIGDATGTGTFGTQVNRIFDDQGNQADLQTLIDQMTADAERGHYATLRDLDSQAQGAGRYGGDSYRYDRTEAQRGLDQEIIRGTAQTRLANADQIRQARLAALGLVNNRDIAALDARTQADIAASNAASSRASNADSLALGRRGQDLQALGMLLDNEHFGDTTLSGLGDRLSTDRLTAAGQIIPGLEGVGLSGLGAANNAGQGMTTLRGISSAASTARAGLNQQAQIYNANAAQQQLNDYLRTLQGIGGMGGTSHTFGTNVVPGAGISVGGATAAGAAAGASQGLGWYDYFRAGR